LGTRLSKRKANHMNWGAIKSIYRYVLIHKNKIEFLGEDRYKIISFRRTGKKHWEREYQNGKLHGIGFINERKQ